MACISSVKIPAMAVIIGESMILYLIPRIRNTELSYSMTENLIEMTANLGLIR